jgi:hypothetical protein
MPIHFVDGVYSHINSLFNQSLIRIAGVIYICKSITMRSYAIISASQCRPTASLI